MPNALERARPHVRAFLAFSVLLMVAAVVQRALQGALTPGGVEQLLAEASAAGGVLRSAAAWEEIHTGAFLYGFLLVTLGSLLAVCPVQPSWRDGWLWGTLVACLGDLLLPLAAFHLPGWAYLRLAGFAIATASILAATVVVWATFGRAPVRGA